MTVQFLHKAHICVLMIKHSVRQNGKKWKEIAFVVYTYINHQPNNATLSEPKQ